MVMQRAFVVAAQDLMQIRAHGPYRPRCARQHIPAPEIGPARAANDEVGIEAEPHPVREEVFGIRALPGVAADEGLQLPPASVEAHILPVNPERPGDESDQPERGRAPDQEDGGQRAHAATPSKVAITFSGGPTLQTPSRWSISCWATRASIFENLKSICCQMRLPSRTMSV